MTATPPPSDSRDQQWPAPQPPPSGGSAPGGPPPRGPRPRTVEISFWLWMVILTFGAVSTLIALTQIERLRTEAINQMVAEDPTLDRAAIESVANGALIGTVVVGLAFVVLGFLFAFLMRGGRNWARIALAVLGGLAVLVGLLGLVTVSGPTAVTSLIQLLLVVGAIATMFGSQANAWFRRPRLEA